MSKRRASYTITLASATLFAGAIVSRAGCAPRAELPAPSVPAASGTAAEPEPAPVVERAAPALDPAPGAGAPAALGPRGVASSATPASAADAALAQGTPASPPAAPAGPAPQVAAQELKLLGQIERELKRDPPPEVHALLGEYRRGAERDALIAQVQRRFPRELSLRVIALRWIDDVYPPAGEPPSEKPKAPAVGTASTWVKPVQRRQ